jgi:apolipoprotein N-acyltransferase
MDGGPRRLPPRWLPFLALAAGATLPFAYAPFDHFWLAPVAVAALFWIWAAATPREAFWSGLCFGIGWFSIGTYWTYISVRQFGGAPIVLSVAATFGLVLILASFFAVAGWAAARWLPLGGPRGRALTLPAVWVLAEWCRGWVFTGFGWLAVGYSQTDSWLMGWSPVFGLQGMNLAVAVTAGMVLGCIYGDSAERRRSIAVLFALWAGGALLTGWQWTQPKARLVTVALAQGAIGQDLKWNPALYAQTLDTYRELTLRGAGKDIIVWPEVAIPNLYSAASDYLDEIRALAASRGSNVLLGILDRPEGTIEPQNVLVALTEPPQFYVKRHLVPFGEYFPVPGFAREWLRLLDLPYNDLSPGDDDQPLLDIAGERIAVTICYEDVFGSEQIGFLPEASLLVNVSNDAWFGDSIAADQHLQIARMRAAEAGRYMLRATNTGISAVIDPRGHVASRAPEFEAALIEDSVQGFTGRTPYALWRDYPVLALVFVVIAAQLATTRLTIRPRT